LFNNLLPSCKKSCPKCTQWLRRDAGASFSRGGGAGRVYGPPRMYEFSFFPCKLYFWNSVTAAKI